jgi:hypothetical protein
MNTATHPRVHDRAHAPSQPEPVRTGPDRVTAVLVDLASYGPLALMLLAAIGWF